MEQTTLGADVCAGAVGHGCAGMSGAYGRGADADADAVHPITDVQIELLALLDSERTGSKH
jgi:hypothetical protein